MIYTITFNPAVDVVIDIDNVKFGDINRTATQQIFYGGKGINVSYVLRNLGRENQAWGFLAGPIGHEMEEALVEDGIDCQFVLLPEGNTRINTKLRSQVSGAYDSPVQRSSIDEEAGWFDDGSYETEITVANTAADSGATRTIETAFNAAGPVADKMAQLKLFSMLQSTTDGDVLVVSGGVLGNVSDHAYARIIESQKGKNVKVVIDATGALLLNTLSHHPFLIKPNNDELAEIVECDPSDYAALVDGARLLRELGAENVLVSRGGDGAFLLDEEGVLHEHSGVQGQLVNSVGAGDSTVAGFVHGYLEALEQGVDDVYEHAFKYALACGSATAFAQGLATKQEIEAALTCVC